MSDKTYGPYRYTLDGRPLVRCPECRGNLTEDAGVCVELVINEKTTPVFSRLEADGTLVDVSDCVANGLHGATLCGHCDEQLVNMEGVSEWVGDALEHPPRVGPRERLPAAVESIDDVIAFAKAHGEDSEPDHEVGDLQDVCRMLWEWLSEEQRHLALPELREYVTDTMGYELPPPG